MALIRNDLALAMASKTSVVCRHITLYLRHDNKTEDNANGINMCRNKLCQKVENHEWNDCKLDKLTNSFLTSAEFGLQRSSFVWVCMSTEYSTYQL